MGFTKITHFKKKVPGNRKYEPCCDSYVHGPTPYLKHLNILRNQSRIVIPFFPYYVPKLRIRLFASRYK
jgi:hypothetical protein